MCTWDLPKTPDVGPSGVTRKGCSASAGRAGEEGIRAGLMAVAWLVGGSPWGKGRVPVRKGKRGCEMCGLGSPSDGWACSPEGSLTITQTWSCGSLIHAPF